MVVRLREFIAQIRACKTAADERAVIAKESASIRTLLKEENAALRHTNVSKLLYIHMLGYPAQFGQIECVKLVASPRFADKRIGYLGIMLLLDENQETLTLVTNCLKSDLGHTNMHHVALGLCTFGNTCSAEMAMDLCPEVEKLLDSSNAYIRKKASLCALRIVHKAPDLRENFVKHCRSALIERNNGPYLTNLALLCELCTFPEIRDPFRSIIPDLIRQLRHLTTAGYSPEHDVSGITDPFMQVRLLRLLRILGTGDAAAGELMNDVLALVATTTDGTKNVGNAILYETVLTILDVPCEQTLRVLAINILGKFLSNRDNNIRYVALQTLLRTIHIDALTLQRHRSTVLDCLRDSDISIRKRALDLAFALTNASNVRVMTRELLSFLEIADVEFRPVIAARLCACADLYAPNPRWHLDTVLRVMKLAGRYLGEDAVSQFVALATNTASLHAYCALRLYWLLKADITQEGLVHTAVWIIGEFADVLVQATPSAVNPIFGSLSSNSNSTAGGAATEDDDGYEDLRFSSEPAPTEENVFELLLNVLESPPTSTRSKQYVLTALAKITTRFTSPAVLSKIRQTFLRHSTDIDFEVQQRAVQYLCMMNLEPSVCKGLWERMPLIELKDEFKYQRNAAAAVAEPVQKTVTVKNDVSALLDLENLKICSSRSVPGPYSGFSFGATPSATSGNAGNGMSNTLGMEIPQQKTAMDLMSEIFSNNNAATAIHSQPQASIVQPASASNGSFQSAAVLGGDWGKELLAYNKPELTVSLTATKENGSGHGASLESGSDALAGSLTVTAAFSARSERIENLQLLVAVPKTMQIQMFPIGTATLQGISNQTTTQRMLIKNTEKKAIKLRLKISYLVGASTGLSRSVDEIVEFKFPASIF